MVSFQRGCWRWYSPRQVLIRFSSFRLLKAVSSWVWTYWWWRCYSLSGLLLQCATALMEKTFSLFPGNLLGIFRVVVTWKFLNRGVRGPLCCMWDDLLFWFINTIIIIFNSENHLSSGINLTEIINVCWARKNPEMGKGGCCERCVRTQEFHLKG